MSRAYVQPKAIIGKLQYQNPNYEVLTNNKFLSNSDSPIQIFDPGNTEYHIILPDASDCEGSFFYIINSSEQSNGLLGIYESTHNDKYINLSNNRIAFVICISSQWGVFDIGVGTFSPSGSGVVLSEVKYV